MPNTMKGVKRISGRSGDSAQFETEARRRRRMNRDFPSGDKEPTTNAAGGRTSMKKQVKMACGGKAKRMAAGGSNSMPMVKKDGKMVPAFAADGKGKMAAGGKAKMMAAGGASKMKKVARNAVKKHEETMHRKGGPAKMVKMAAGGSFKAKCDGAAQRGRTRGKVT